MITILLVKNGFNFNNLVCFIADGDLPQGIADGCFLFTEIGTSYVEGDLIIDKSRPGCEKS